MWTICLSVGLSVGLSVLKKRFLGLGACLQSLLFFRGWANIIILGITERFNSCWGVSFSLSISTKPAKPEKLKLNRIPKITTSNFHWQQEASQWAAQIVSSFPRSRRSGSCRIWRFGELGGSGATFSEHLSVEEVDVRDQCNPRDRGCCRLSTITKR